MKILLVSPLPPPAGGIATWTETFIKFAAEKSKDVKLINTAVIGERVNNFLKINIFQEVKRTINILNQVVKENKIGNFDILHLNTSCSKYGIIRDYIIIKIVEKNKNIKIILHCHCDVYYMLKGNISKNIFHKLCKKSDEIFVLNKDSKKYISEKTLKKADIIPNFIEGKFILNGSKYINKEIKKILYVGHVIKSKGCDDILELACMFKEKKFILAGYLSEEIKAIRKPSNVIFTGEVNKESIIKFMDESDILIFPTHTEGFPNVILESMARGLPIIATNVGAIPDMIEENGGILVNVKEIEAMKNAINSLEDVNLRRKMSEWNINKVKSMYDIERVLDHIFSKYDRLV